MTQYIGCKPGPKPLLLRGKPRNLFLSFRSFNWRIPWPRLSEIPSKIKSSSAFSCNIFDFLVNLKFCCPAIAASYLGDFDLPLIALPLTSLAFIRVLGLLGNPKGPLLAFLLFLLPKSNHKLPNVETLTSFFQKSLLLRLCTAPKDSAAHNKLLHRFRTALEDSVA